MPPGISKRLASVLLSSALLAGACVVCPALRCTLEEEGWKRPDPALRGSQCRGGQAPHGNTLRQRAAPAQTFSLKHSERVRVEVVHDGQVEEVATNGKQRWLLSPSTTLRVTMSQASTEASSDKVTVNYYEEEGNMPIDQAGLFLTAIEISLDVDADRDGVVEKNNPRKASWTWGPAGQGAILLVNCDRDTPWLPKEDLKDEKVYSKEDLKDMSQMILRTKGPDRLPAGYEIVLYISMADSDKVGVFYVENPFFGQRYIHILGRRKLYHVVKYTGGSAELMFFVEGLRFPDEGFPGLVSIHVSLLEYMAEEIPLTPIFTDTVIFRIAPWIMTPNILPPVSVFVCCMKDNYLFLKEVKNLVEKTNCELKVCFQYVNRGDRWIQGPDFGYVTREPLFEPVTSLDSFGNLEVSPPVTVNGKTYPLGRILIGSSFPLSGGRRMTKVVRDFLQAQQVQAPVELYSDWLTVGHVDEFMTFVPIPGTKKFRGEKQREGHGEAIMFKGLGGMSSKRITINKILSNESLVQENQYFQRCLDWNRDILKKELGLTEQDIIDLPALFKMDEDRQARAYFPNMVNMIVLDKDLGIPKPFGPQVDEVCCLETHVRSLLEPLGLCCTFVDDISAYHKFLGEVHCGTNVRRKPFSFKWWHMVP
uniref:Peptidyl arginine deiminase 2 n=1 Tax=Ursus maritimus TaxID=29073 RepID=A0A452V7N9_URSMA